MAEKPILFNTEMVRAILDGRKRQTRRIIKGLPLYEPYFEEDEGRGFLMASEDGQFYTLEAFSAIKPGDVLYVRETWADIPETAPGNLHYRADATRADLDWFREKGWKWRPSIHMPKDAARIFLKVMDVRAERLQSITPQEIRAEGLDVLGLTKQMTVKAWRDLWNSTVKGEDIQRYGWAANPWVWVIEFERCEKL